MNSFFSLLHDLGVTTSYIGFWDVFSRLNNMPIYCSAMHAAGTAASLYLPIRTSFFLGHSSDKLGFR